MRAEIMSLGRRKVGIDEPSRWVFNRMADVYGARPAYPAALIEALADLARSAGGDGKDPVRIADLGAGIGHVALPLAERAFDVVAIEPARLMLDQLRAAAVGRGLRLQTCHAPAENLPLKNSSVDVVIIADALHFLDAELTAREVARVLAPGGALAVVTCEFGATPFMQEVRRVIEGAVPRRPRALVKQMVHLSSIAKVPLTVERRFHDHTPVDNATLDRILRSISFIGPAMNPQRLEDFRARVHGLSDAPVWARTFALHCGQRMIPAAVRRERARAAPSGSPRGSSGSK
ncbi:MAG: class I SAM-dependent methyltransferase [Deltaproteobacteria bacterium]|nr:class I SAM-dependent methyltransferase [Deltaproteobacteria bacterium]